MLQKSFSPSWFALHCFLSVGDFEEQTLRKTVFYLLPVQWGKRKSRLRCNSRRSARIALPRSWITRDSASWQPHDTYLISRIIGIAAEERIKCTQVDIFVVLSLRWIYRSKKRIFSTGSRFAPKAEINFHLDTLSKRKNEHLVSLEHARPWKSC